MTDDRLTPILALVSVFQSLLEGSAGETDVTTSEPGQQRR